jgi:hypothetical protein
LQVPVAFIALDSRSRHCDLQAHIAGCRACVICACAPCNVRMPDHMQTGFWESRLTEKTIGRDRKYTTQGRCAVIWTASKCTVHASPQLFANTPEADTTMVFQLDKKCADADHASFLCVACCCPKLRAPKCINTVLEHANQISITGFIVGGTFDPNPKLMAFHLESAVTKNASMRCHTSQGQKQFGQMRIALSSYLIGVTPGLNTTHEQPLCTRQGLASKSRLRFFF